MANAGAAAQSAARDVSPNGCCGAPGQNTTCLDSGFGDCCSAGGYCGDSAAHYSAGCQSTFGNCTTGADTANISLYGGCGPKNGDKTCKGSSFDDCCSSSSHRGGESAFYGAGCNAAYGTCNGGSGSVSTDGACGAKSGKTCVGSAFGNCCSTTGSCGKTYAHCGQGCQKSFYNSCLTSNIPSMDGTCGSARGGLTCAGGGFDGQCCSADGYCGKTSAHCSSGCQKSFGKCN